jgi:hypothetical protein
MTIYRTKYSCNHVWIGKALNRRCGAHCSVSTSQYHSTKHDLVARVCTTAGAVPDCLQYIFQRLLPARHSKTWVICVITFTRCRLGTLQCKKIVVLRQARYLKAMVQVCAALSKHWSAAELHLRPCVLRRLPHHCPTSAGRCSNDEARHALPPCTVRGPRMLAQNHDHACLQCGYAGGECAT